MHPISRSFGGHSRAVEAFIGYSVPLHLADSRDTYEPSNRERAAGVRRRNYMVPIYDARCEPVDPDLDHNGFELAALKTKAWDPATDKLDRSVYARQLGDLISSRMEATMEVTLSIVRRGENRSPLLFAHNNFNFDFGPERVKG